MMEYLGRVLYNLGVPLGPREFLVYLAGSLMVIGLLLYVFLPGYLPILPAVPLIVFILLDYLYRRKVQRIEEELPRYIHLLSTYPLQTLRDAVKLGTSGFEELSTALSEAWRLIDTGVSPSRALHGVASRIGSGEVERIFRTLIEAFRSGVSQDLLKNLSEELYFVNELRKEAKGILSLQRYSIFLSTSFLVPFILGLSVKVVRGLSGQASSPSAIPLYLLLLAFVSGSYLAWVEGKPKNAPLYILSEVFLSLSTYSVVAWLY